MNSFFSLEGPLISFLDKCGRIVMLTVLWIVCCMPVFTIGASSASFYYGIAKTIRHERSSAAKEFFRCFKRVFKNSILPTIIFIVLLVVLIIDALVWYGKGTGKSLLYTNLCVLMLVILVAVFCYYSATLSRFLYSSKELVKLSAFLAFKHLPVTLLFLVIIAITVFLVVIYPVFALFVPGVACMVISRFMENVLKKYIPKPREGEEVWYDE